VKGDEGAAAIPFGKLVALVEEDVVGGPMTREADDRLRQLVAGSDLLAVAAVLRVQLLLLLQLVVVVIGPAAIESVGDLEELLGRQQRALPARIETRPAPIEIIAPVLKRVERASLAIPRHRHDAADAGGVPSSVALRLIETAVTELPDAPMPVQFIARLASRRFWLAILLLTRVTRGAEWHEHVAASVERDWFGDVLVGAAP
jgi:hypothetical protein